LTNVGLKAIDAMAVSHGHFDHYGGLVGFLQKYRNALPADVKLYAGGEDNFCRRYGGAPGALTEFGALGRRELVANKVSVVLAESVTVVAGHAFTTGKIKRSGCSAATSSDHPGVGVALGRRHRRRARRLAAHLSGGRCAT
jgi:7,8-dihydropterin-6-yl-methyl-4-(beta-D-ribofuranosyl)aminobenzene 5'-phosphate synthase